MKWIYLLVCAAFLASCNEEDDITPREGGEVFYTLPQGNHDYDDKIVEYYNKYGFYILYKFGEKDLYWNNTGWAKSMVEEEGFYYVSEATGDLLGEPADPEYVGPLLKLIENNMFNIYPEDYLYHLPLRFLLCSSMGKVVSAGIQYVDGVAITLRDTLVRYAYCNFNRFAVNGASETIETMSSYEKSDLLGEANGEFMNLLYSNDLFELCEEFTTISDYTYAYLTGENLFKRGFLAYGTLVSNNPTQSHINDFEDYMKLITIPLEVLEGEPAPISSSNYQSTINPPLQGALNPKRDVNGLVRQKYEILIKYFKEKYGIDTDRWQYPDL